jgi:hypothetical protein
VSTKQQEKLIDEQEKQERSHLNAAIGKHVILTLGQPRDLHKVQVRPLWGDHYRVNVLVGVDAATAKVAHSYFLVVDGAGNILTSNPQIGRQY